MSGVKATATVRGELVEIVSAGSPAGDIAHMLLAAADHPRQVRTFTGPSGVGWIVPAAVATKAGLVTKRRGRKPSKVTPDA